MPLTHHSHLAYLPFTRHATPASARQKMPSLIKVGKALMNKEVQPIRGTAEVLKDG